MKKSLRNNHYLRARSRYIHNGYVELYFNPVEDMYISFSINKNPVHNRLIMRSESSEEAYERAMKYVKAIEELSMLG